EAERADALTEVLAAEIASRPEDIRGGVLAALASLYPLEPVAASGSLAARLAELEGEVMRLQTDLAAARATLAPAPPPASSAVDAAGIVEALLGSAERSDATEERLTTVIHVLVAFADNLGRTFLGATADPGETMAGRIRALIADESA